MNIGYEDWSNAILGRSWRVTKTEWNAIASARQPDEEQLSASKGWIMGASVGDPEVDQPCIVFITDRAIYVDIRPQTLPPKPELIVAPFPAIGRAGTTRNDVGGTRLVFAFDSAGHQNVADIRAVGVDLPRGRRGAAFGQLVMTTARRVIAMTNTAAAPSADAETSGRRFHVSFGAGPGATFFVADEATSITWRHDPGLSDDVHTATLVDAALSELEVALGRSPSLLRSPHPFYVPEWEPPLPTQDKPMTPRSSNR